MTTDTPPSEDPVNRLFLEVEQLRLRVAAECALTGTPRVDDLAVGGGLTRAGEPEWWADVDTSAYGTLSAYGATLTAALEGLRDRLTDFLDATGT